MSWIIGISTLIDDLLLPMAILARKWVGQNDLWRIIYQASTWSKYSNQGWIMAHNAVGSS
jgi:hypothetical protein